MSAPNILLIIVDDLNSWIGCLGGHPDADTPHMDKLASEGVLFSQAYCPAPYCNASRMSMFTGQAPYNSGIYLNQPYWSREHRIPTIFERFRSAGYSTIGAGKVFHGAFDYGEATRNRKESASWVAGQFHNDAIWDEFLPLDSDPVAQNRPLNGLYDFSKDDADFSKKRCVFDWGVLNNIEAEQFPDVASARFIASQFERTHAKPFFCALGLYKPHLPWHAPSEYFDRFLDRNPALPLVKHDDLDDAPPIAAGWVKSGDDHARILENDQWHAAVASYLACCTFCDDCVGMALESLNNSPYADNTIVVLCSDNGFHLGQKLHWRKFVLWEEATKVPLIIKAPGGDSNIGICAAPVSLVDIGPTLYEICGISADEELDGVSLAESLREPEKFERTAPVISTWGKGNHSIRIDHWRYTVYADGGEELFDHRVDRHEWRNLAADPNYRRVLESVRRLAPARG